MINGYRVDWDKNVTGYILHVQRLPKNAEKIYGEDIDT